MKGMKFLVLTLVCLTARPALSAPVVVERGHEAVQSLYRRSYALEAQNDINGALATLDELRQLGATDYTLLLREGWLLYLAGRQTESVSAYEKAIALERKAVEPRLGQMLPLMAMRRWKQAEERAKEVLAIAPNDSTALSRIAYIHYVQGRYAEAAVWYRKVLALYPANVEMRAGLGWSLLKQKDLSSAKRELTQVLMVAPDHASAKEGLALLQGR